MEIFTDASFWTGTLVGIVILKFIEKVFVNTFDLFVVKLRLLFLTKKVKEILIFDDMPKDIYDNIKFGLIHVRFGNDAFLNNTPTAIEKQEMNLINKVKFLDSKYISNKYNPRSLVTLEIKNHKKFGTQFKAFVEVTDTTYSKRVYKYLKTQNGIMEISKSGSQYERYYFIIKKFCVIEVGDNINNFLYPK